MTEDSPLKKQPERAPAPAREAAVRASDADRDRIAEILREALAEGRLDAAEHAERLDAVYEAKTLGELEPLIADLPAGARSRQAPRAEAAPSEYRWEAPRPGGWKENLVAIFSASVRKGRWNVPPRINAVSVFGSVEIDLSQAVFTEQYIVINATAVFGSVEIQVPENVTLRQKGAGVFGSFDVECAEATDPQAPVVLVQGAGVLGSVEAKPKRGRLLRNLRAGDRLRKEE
ncbi:DUF1707 SHOCT-like domain-containing protein [Streptomyces sulphureus]|uniref:DUF1707 SHOCT-like domain-containing protein n=1 Tax=Streptomyces sulphureus TaxID=47758 RepID=UPI00036DC16F|nr:DUF1707 domain-containing protein [Streptomyces sulphureus]